MINIQKKYAAVNPIQTLWKVAQKETEIKYGKKIDPGEIEAVLRDGGLPPALTPREQYDALQRVRVEKQAVLKQVVNALHWDWANVKEEFQTLQREKTGAADRAAKQWDYARLEFARTTAREFMAKASPDEIKKRYKEIEISGDTHALRGFVEIGLQTVKEPFDKIEFKRMHEQLTMTAEMKALARQGELLTGKIRELNDFTEQAKGQYYQVDPALGDDVPLDKMFTPSNNPFDAMRKGITIKQRVRAEDLVTITEVDINLE